MEWQILSSCTPLYWIVLVQKDPLKYTRARDELLEGTAFLYRLLAEFFECLFAEQKDTRKTLLVNDDVCI